MSGESHRWQGPKSDFPWEEDALQHIRDQMPDAEPYRAWQTFTFTAPSGHVREVDLFLAAPGGLFLVEIKSHPGRPPTTAPPGSSAATTGPERSRTRCTSPTEGKGTQESAPPGRSRASARAVSRGSRPPSSSPRRTSAANSTSSSVTASSAGTASRSRPPPRYLARLPQPATAQRQRPGDPHLVQAAPKLLHKLGVQRLRKNGRVGPYELGPRAFDAGPTWEDYLAENTALPGDEPRRIRIYLSELEATKPERSPPAALPAASTWPCRASRTTASPRRAVQRRARGRARGRLPARQAMAAARPVHGRAGRTCPSRPGSR